MAGEIQEHTQTTEFPDIESQVIGLELERIRRRFGFEFHDIESRWELGRRRRGFGFPIHGEEQFEDHHPRNKWATLMVGEIQERTQTTDLPDIENQLLGGPPIHWEEQFEDHHPRNKWAVQIWFATLVLILPMLLEKTTAADRNAVPHTLTRFSQNWGLAKMMIGLTFQGCIGTVALLFQSQRNDIKPPLILLSVGFAVSFGFSFMGIVLRNNYPRIANISEMLGAASTGIALYTLVLWLCPLF